MRVENIKATTGQDSWQSLFLTLTPFPQYVIIVTGGAHEKKKQE